jgi:hypothetical protein
VPILASSVTTSSKVRKRVIAQTRWRLRATERTFRFFARGLGGFAPRAERVCNRRRPHRVVSEQVLLRPRATVLAEVRGTRSRYTFVSPIFSNRKSIQWNRHP